MAELDIDAILEDAQRIAVVGWSPQPGRDSKRIAAYLHQAGYEVLPVNPNYAGQEVHGHEVVARMTELEDVDIVDVFRRSDDVPMHVPEAIELEPGTFWMQLGIRNEAAADRLEAAGIQVVQDRCIMVEHRNRLA